MILEGRYWTCKQNSENKTSWSYCKYPFKGIAQLRATIVNGKSMAGEKCAVSGIERLTVVSDEFEFQVCTRKPSI